MTEELNPENVLDKAISDRRQKELYEAWMEVTGKEGVPPEIEEAAWGFVKEVLSARQLTGEWYLLYMRCIALCVEQGMSEPNAVWFLIQTIAVIAGTTGFKMGIAAAEEAKEV